MTSPAAADAARAWSHYQREEWAEALTAANNGLVLDSEHVVCANLRALALIKLGRREEAAGTLSATLDRVPTDALAHATKGWLLLEESRPDEALVEFRAARRFDPSLESSRLGTVTAMKAHHSTYGIFLRYLLWTGRIGGKARTFFVLGLWGGIQLINQVSVQTAVAATGIKIIVYAYVAFVWISWLADPLFNLSLLLTKAGRSALSPSERWSGVTVALNILIAGALFAGGAFGWPLGPTLGYYALLWLLPLAAIWTVPGGAARPLMAAYSFALLANLLGAFTLPPGLWIPVHDAFTLYAWGCILAWIPAGVLSSGTRKRA